MHVLFQNGETIIFLPNNIMACQFSNSTGSHFYKVTDVPFNNGPVSGWEWTWLEENFALGMSM